MKKNQPYKGFEQGPIRPPSEARSLLIRVTRNCPWNHCRFCPVYKNKKFSLRPVDHVIKDIDSVKAHIEKLIDTAQGKDYITQEQMGLLLNKLNPEKEKSFYAAMNWFSNGMRSIFIQDANSLIIKPENLITILKYLRKTFPNIDRITSYARSHTISRIKDEHLLSMRKAGLNRIHIGMESGSDEVLKLIKKGTTKKDHIIAGLKVKKAGMELSEYVMPGLGGKKFSEVHAKETADALNQINPDFIRLRTLAIPKGIPLWELRASGSFEECSDIMKVQEILIFLKTLSGITSVIKSDHILNLFEEVKGAYPQDKEKMCSIIENFLEMPSQKQICYQVGRRFGIFRCLRQMKDTNKMAKVNEICQNMQITKDNVDEVIKRMMNQFI